MVPEPARGGPAGDALVEIRVAPHPFFRRAGDDVICTVPLAFTQAALGAEVEAALATGVGGPRRLIAQFGAGVDNIDVATAVQRGIPTITLYRGVPDRLSAMIGGSGGARLVPYVNVQDVLAPLDRALEEVTR